MVINLLQLCLHKKPRLVNQVILVDIYFSIYTTNRHANEEKLSLKSLQKPALNKVVISYKL